MNRPRQLHIIWITPLLIAWTISLGAQCVMSCRTNLQVSLNVDGYRALTPDMLLDDNATCTDPFYLDIDGPLTDTVSCAEVGQYLTVLVQHVTTGERCYSQIQVVDNLAPTIICPDEITIHCTDSLTDLNITGEPVVFENCEPDLSFTDNLDSLTVCNTGYVDRTFMVEDPGDNEANCIQRIYMLDTIPPVIEFPEDISLGCLDNAYNLSVTGEPEISDDCSTDIGTVYTDAIFPTCGGSRRIVRKWEVIDWCNYHPLTGEGVYTHEQVIAMLDELNPVITCPSNLTVGNDPGTCEATLLLPEASATDECSSVEIIPQIMVDGDLEELDPDYEQIFTLGVHEIFYIAEDACGNADTCSSWITVIDDEDPVVVTPLSKTFSITTGGSTRVESSDLDDGSYDNCAIDTILISRDSVNYAGFLDFTCIDVPESPIPIQFKVIDNSGNEVINTVIVVLKDKLYPNIYCPDDVSIFCQDDPQDVELTGEAVGNDNCSYEITFQDDSDVNDCGLGTIIRSWVIEDIDGNQTTCQQIITIQDTTSAQIYIPTDTILTCGTDTHPDITGYADVEDDCGDFGFSYTDDVFFIHPPESYRLFRHWKVVNFCDTAYEEVFTQLIEVLDTVAPEITCTQDTIISTADSSCQAFVSLEASVTDNCSDILIIDHNSQYADSIGNNASGIYPAGIHEILFTARDASENENTCAVTVEVVDSVPPAPVCQLGLLINLPSDGIVDISPDFVDAASFDNCTDTADLERVVIPSRFSCETLGEVEVTLTITDEAGNQSSCVSTITVQDNAGHCPELIDISGLLITEYGDEINGAMVTLIGDGGDTLTSDDAGTFMFTDQPVGSNYVVKPEITEGPSNGISTYDFLLIRKHILNDQVFDSPYKMIAADANNSSSISTFDIVVLRRLLLNHIQELPNNPAWRFVDAEYLFPDPFDPFTDPFPEEVFLDGVMDDRTGVDFIGVKIGDVNGTATPGNATGNGSVRNDFRDLPVRLKLQRRGQVLKASLFMPAGVTLEGFQFSIQFDPAQVKLGEVTWTELNGFNAENIAVDQSQNTLHVSWDGLPGVEFREMEPLLHIELMSANGYIEPVDLISIPPEGLHPEAYNDLGQINELVFIPEVEQTDKVVAFPNPFREEVFLPLRTDKNELANLVVYDNQGKICYREEQVLYPRDRYWLLKGHRLPDTGIYYYEIHCGDSRMAGKIHYLK